MPAITTGGPQPANPVESGPGTAGGAPADGAGTPTGDLSGAGPGALRRRPPVGRWASLGRRAGAGMRAGQLVTGQVAVALVLAALGRGAPVTVAAVLAATLLVAIAWVRVRGRWLFEWLGTGAAHLTRRRALGGPAGPAELLDLVAPGAVVRSTELSGGPAAVLEDTGGMVVLLELGDPGDLLGDASRAIAVAVRAAAPTRRRTSRHCGSNCCSPGRRRPRRRRAARSARRTGSSPTGGSPGGNGRCWRSGCCGWTAGRRRTCAGCSPARYAGSSVGSGR